MGIFTKDKNADKQRTFAEWASFSVSLLIVLALVGYLVSLCFQKERTFFSVQFETLPEETVQREGKYILPVRAYLPAGRALSKVGAAVKIHSEKSGESKFELTFDYLAPHAEQRAYLYLDEKPENLAIEVKPIYYTLE